MRDAPCHLGLAGEDRLHWSDERTGRVTAAASSRDLVGGSISSLCVSENLGASAMKQASDEVILVWEH